FTRFGPDKVIHFKGPLPKKILCSLLFQFNDLSHDGIDRGGGNRAVLCRDLLFSFVADVLQYLLEVFQVQKGQMVLVTIAEKQCYNALLGGIEVENAGDQYGTKFGDCGFKFYPCSFADRHQFYREGFRLIVHPDGFAPGNDEVVHFTRHGQSGKVALEIHQDYGNAFQRKLFRQDLKCFRLPGAGCPGNQTMSVEGFERNLDLAVDNGLAIQYSTSEDDKIFFGGIALGYLLLKFLDLTRAVWIEVVPKYTLL